MRITQHFSTAEFERSQTAARAGIEIHVIPGTDIWTNVKALCTHVLEPLRDLLDKPIIISSGYRPEAVNDLVGGAPDSQHTKGQAADFHVDGIADYDLAQFVAASGLPYDQCIYEFGRWVHVSYDPGRAQQRGDVLTAWADGEGNTHYAQGVVAIASIEGARR